LIGRVHQPIHTFFSNARWLAEGTLIVYTKILTRSRLSLPALKNLHQNLITS
jgi:hypothetical protein